MSDLIVQPASSLKGVVEVPGDKSITHRALLLGAVADGPSYFSNLNCGRDCLATVNCLRQLGIEIEIGGEGRLAVVRGRGLWGLQPPAQSLYCGNSATTMRLLAGLLVGQAFEAMLVGSPQLKRRPMDRVIIPLRSMGAEVTSPDGVHSPLTVHGRPLRSVEIHLPVASAQVKSAVLLAALVARVQTGIHEPAPSRDHTEVILAAMGAALTRRGLSLRMEPSTRVHPLGAEDDRWFVPGDLSAAAFLLVAGCLIPDSQVQVRRTGLNPTRTGLLEALRRMGAQVSVRNAGGDDGEPYGDLEVCTAGLQATTVDGVLTVRLIDEVPILAVAATQAQGRTMIAGAQELRVKETDRLHALRAELTRMGARIVERADGLVIEGPTPLRGTAVVSHGDHRLVMALTIAGLLATGQTIVRDAECVADSFPGFVEALGRLGADVAYASVRG
jgi:3-phosphoshikimate 1-carboxyvinyltransferase